MDQANKEVVSKYVKAKEVAELLGCHQRTVLNWRAAGLIPFYRFGRTIRFVKSEVEEELRRRNLHGASLN